MDQFSIEDREIQEITREGIRYPGGFIDFADCAARFHRENGGSGACVGESCAGGEPPYLAFHTQTLMTRIVFQSGNKFRELLHKATPALQRMQALKGKLTEFGYSTFDIS